MNNPEHTAPSPKVAAMLGALATKYKISSLDDTTLDTMYTVPEEQWPPGLGERVETLLNAPVKPAGKPIVEVKAFKITFTTKVGDLPPAPELVPGKKIMPMEVIFQCKGDKLKAELNGRSYRKALLNDPQLTAIIQGKLEGGKIIEAGITVATPKDAVQAAKNDASESEAQGGNA